MESTDHSGEWLVEESVTENEIAEAVARATGIPVAKLVQGEQKNYSTYLIICISELWDKIKPSQRYLMLS